MKFIDVLRTKKWLVIGIAVLCALLIAAGCLLLIPGSEPTVADGEGGQMTPGQAATIVIKNKANAVIEGVQVYIYGDEAMTDLVSFDTTDAAGKITFIPTKSSHVVVLKGLAPGYKVAASYTITAAENTIVLEALAPTADGKLPTDVKYNVGDPVMDFTVTDIDGNTYTASQVLQEKKALVLHFWNAAGEVDFTYLQKAYDAYKQDLLVLALAPSAGDATDSIKALRDANGVTLPLVAADNAWTVLMNVQFYPTTVVIDRFGIVAMFRAGAVTEEGVYEEIFAQYTDAAYNPNPDTPADGTDSTTPSDGTTDSTTQQSGLKTEFVGVLGTKDAPIEIGGTLTFSTEIPAGKESYFNVYRVGGTVLTIKSGNVAVDYDGKTYTPKNGVVEIPVTTDDVTIPVKFVVRNTGKDTEKYTVNFVYPKGTLANPYDLQMGELTTNIKKGNDQGVVYVYKAPNHGIVEMVGLSATNGAKYDFVLYNLNTYANRTLGEDSENNTVSIAVNKGDTLQVTVGVLPNAEHEYPASVIKSKLTFTPTDGPVTKPTLPSTATFAVTVKDDKGAAMPGVAMKFEVGSQAKTVLTDANGVASAVMDYGNCKATITVPDGYVAAKLSCNLTPDAPTAVMVLEEDSWFDDPVVPDPPVEPDDPVDPDIPVDPQPPVDTTMDYTVTLVDGMNAVQSGITVEIYTASNQLAATAVTDENGVAAARLEKGNYIVKLSGTDLKYDERTAVLTAAKPNLELLVASMYDVTVYSSVNCPLDSVDKKAYYLNEGATFVELTPGTRNYFLYEPTRNGTFRFTTTNVRATIGYYGSPFFLQSSHIGEEIEDNAFTISISQVGPTYVLAVDAPTNISGAIVVITRVGDPGWSVHDEPWEIYEGTYVPTSKYTLPANTTLTNVDITGPNVELVYNTADGYYHLNAANGPVVYLRFTGSPYVNLADIVFNQRIGAILYDGNGEFVKKEEYNAYMKQYYYVPNPMYDPTGKPINLLDSSEMVYPLNSDLLYILQTYAGQQKWCDPDSPTYLFKDTEGEIVPGINNEIAWMFPLCYGN
ncbi:MAG: redoxin domain-containing protein [Clostridia bacterium]|nr:redoxin domain-containing protein [Clostridia bacterium]